MSIRSSSSSSSETEEITVGGPEGSVRSENIQRSTPRYRQESSTASQLSGHSGVATGTPYDTTSIGTNNTGFTNATNVSATTAGSQQASVPIIAPPVLSQQQLLRNGSDTPNKSIQNNVASAQQQQYQQQYQQQQQQQQQQQYQQQQQQYQPQQQQQQPHFDAAKAIFTQVDANRDGAISREEFRQWAQGGNQAGGQFQYQQAQFSNQTQAQQHFHPSLDPDAFNDVVLNIDYGVIEAYNVGFQSAGDITAEKLSGGFDAAKAIFNQVDANHDGAISRDEFRQWAQHGQQNYGGQSNSNYQTTANYGNNFNNPQLADILQQSGLGQAYGSY